MALIPNDSNDALKAALKVMEKGRVYNIHRAQIGYKPVQLSIGVHYGPLMLGTIGESSRMDVTVIADAVNVASRVEELNKAHGSSILITRAIYDNLKTTFKKACQSLGEQEIRGRKNKIEVYKIKTDANLS
ncbi:MAG: adenylate/guanylate cyclase domain-containing protein [Fibrobacter sp.]|nr:adenylate/guanylate cyclase domain-containing protein [Fibrobacter sp.]